MEFGEDAEYAQPSEELGLAARLTKKTKTQDKGDLFLNFTSTSSKDSTFLSVLSYFGDFLSEPPLIRTFSPKMFCSSPI